LLTKLFQYIQFIKEYKTGLELNKAVLRCVESLELLTVISEFDTGW